MWKCAWKLLGWFAWKEKKSVSLKWLLAWKMYIASHKFVSLIEKGTGLPGAGWKIPDEFGDGT